MSGHGRRRRAKQLQFEMVRRRSAAEAARRQSEGSFIHGQRGYSVPVDLSSEARDFDAICAAIGRLDLMVNPPQGPDE